MTGYWLEFTTPLPMPDQTPVRARTEDRCVHARDADGMEIVRYDRAGKWYVEKPGHRRVRLTLAKAATIATDPGWQPLLGVPGGRRFDAAVRKRQENR